MGIKGILEDLKSYMDLLEGASKWKIYFMEQYMK
jgi:hypothetical protein